MARIVQARDPELSVFQSAIDEVALRRAAGNGAQSIGEAIESVERPGVEDPMVRQAVALTPEFAHLRATGEAMLPIGPAPTGPVTAGIGDVVKYCASLAFNYAKAKVLGNNDLAQRYSEELNAKFGSCDPSYAQAAEQTLVYFNMQKGVIPFQQWANLSDFVIDDGGRTLPENATVAVIGDWGTGQQQAMTVLQHLADKRPNVVIHLGDVYYSGTDIEEQHYFFDNWARILELQADATTRVVQAVTPATYTLAGNHDMYCGGAPYYKMIQQLRQRASYFCLRNAGWQLIGLDTGYYDHGLSGPPTRLAPNQPQWLADKMTSSDARKTILFSHHQLFSDQETFTQPDGTQGAINPNLLQDVQTILPNVSLWLWGHQHQFVAYASDLVKGRCMGHGAYPVGISEIPIASTAIPIDPAIAPQQKGTAFWDNGYTVIQLQGANATVTYYAVDENGDERPNPSQEEI